MTAAAPATATTDHTPRGSDWNSNLHSPPAAQSGVARIPSSQRTKSFMRRECEGTPNEKLPLPSHPGGEAGLERHQSQQPEGQAPPNLHATDGNRLVARHARNHLDRQPAPERLE